MVGKKISILSAILVALVFSGALGLKTEDYCTEHFDYIEQPGEYALCIHEVAVSYASLGDGVSASSYCEEIKSLGGIIDSNIVEGQANLCYGDIARILNDASYCEEITQTNFADIIAGAEITKEICEQNANVTDVMPACVVGFVFLPMLAVAAFILYRRP